MKKLYIAAILTGAFFISLLSLGCKNIIEPSHTQPSDGKGTVIISFTAGAGKTALSPDDMVFDSCQFTFSRNGESVYFEEKSGNTYTFCLETGDGYTLNVKAFSKGSLAAEGLSSVFSIKTSPTVVPVNLKGKLSGETKGSFSYVINYPENTRIEELVLLMDDNTEHNILLMKETETPEMSISGSVDVAAGWYFLVVRLSKTGSAAKAGYANGVAIYPGQTTHYGTQEEPKVFTDTHFKTPEESFVAPGVKDGLAGKLLILQAYGSSATAAGVSHPFAELYNNTDNPIELDGITLYYADGVRGPGVTQDDPWKSIPLAGTIPAKASYLILGQNQSSGARLQITEGYGDINDSGFTLSNRAFKIALLRNSGILAAQNPFTMDGVGIAAGYIDMVGAANDLTHATNPDNIFGYETSPARCSASEAVRRKDLNDSDDNSADFIAARYASGGLTDGEVEVRRPKNSADSAEGWDPFPPPVIELPDPSASILIFQIGAATDGNVSHSFVELYNTGDSAITLTGNYSLQYAAGFSTNAGNGAPGGNTTTDGPWNKINLTGKIEPGHSFLILGNKGTSGNPALSIQDSYGDMNVAFDLNNRAVKVALMKNQTLLTVQNPYSENIAGYVDMVGAVNTAGADYIQGFEGRQIADLNKQTGQRRTSLTDTNVNFADFARATFAGASADELERLRPKNHAYGNWDPFSAPKPLELNVGLGTKDVLAGKLLILQAYGSSSDASGVSHSFVELYNNTDNPIELNGITLYYADGVRGTGVTQDTPWKSIALTGSIPAKASYLILGPNQGSASARLNIADGYGDINSPEFTLSNRAFKAALLRNTKILGTQNPFTMDGAGIAAGYIDMVGAANNLTASNPDNIFGYETAPARCSASEAVRRKNLADTDNNQGVSSVSPDGTGDFDSIRYAADGLTDEEVAVRRPRNSRETNAGWNPFEEPKPPAAKESKTLMILQANTYGNSNSPLGSGFERSVVELYNNTDASINLSTGNYYLHIGNASAWTNAIKLTGTVPSKCSYLIVDNTAASSSNTNTTPRAILPKADQYASFILENTGFKVAVLRNQTTVLKIDNPFGNTSPASNYIDMLGVLANMAAEGSPFLNQSRPRVPRRASLLDTDNNAADFKDVDYRSSNDANLPAAELYKVWPRNSAGTWNPITGLPRKDPEMPSSPEEPFNGTLSFSHDSGLFSQTFYLTLTAPGAAIYYSTDGSIPSPGKTGTVQYTSPISVINRTTSVQTNVLASSDNILQMYPSKTDPNFSDTGSISNYVPSPAQVPKATVIRAIAMDGEGRQSPVITKTYFIGNNLDAYSNIPVISLVSDPDNLVSVEKGILVRGDPNNKWYNTFDADLDTKGYNFLRRGAEWERNAFMEIFDGNGSSIPVSTDVGIRIRGGYSRAFAQKSFNVYFRTGTLQNYDLIPGTVKADGVTPVGKYKNFILRNGGNDTALTKLYDVIAQELVKDRNFSTQASRPCVVYLNGEYWGPYNIQEKYSDDHTEYKYGVAKSEVIAYENWEVDSGIPSDESLYYAMITAGKKTMTNQTNYNAFKNLVDIEGLIDYFAAEIYLSNYDGLRNNFRMWRTRNYSDANPYSDQKWRFQMFDMDYTMGLYGNGLTGNIGGSGRDIFDLFLTGGNGYDMDDLNKVVKALFAREDFVRQFVNTIMDLRNVNFHPNNWGPKVNAYEAIYKPLMLGTTKGASPSYFQRWGYPYGNTSAFENYMTYMRTYLTNMYKDMAEKYLPQYFAGGSGSSGIYNIGITSAGLCNVTLAVQGASGASIKINTVTPNLAGGNWTGQYYKENPVTVTANVPSGCQFTGWTVTGGNAAAPASATTTVTITGNATITANFR